MNDLCARLKNVNESGIYQLYCSVDAMCNAAEAACFAIFDADLAAVQGKGEFLAAIGRSIKAPAWFGNNWDALADALGDLAWQPSTGYILLLRNSGNTLGLAEADHQIAMEIFKETSACWKSQGKPFWIFFS